MKDKKKKDKSRQWYFYQGFLASQDKGLIRLDEPYVIKDAQREAFAKFVKNERAYRSFKKKKVWRTIRE